RAHPFAANSQASIQEEDGASYRDVMAARDLEREEARIQAIIAEKKAKGENGVVEHKASLKDSSSDKENADAGSAVAVAGRKRKQRWDVSSETPAESNGTVAEEATTTKKSRWDAVPAAAGTDEAETKKRSRWDQAPLLAAAPGQTPAASIPAP